MQKMPINVKSEMPHDNAIKRAQIDAQVIYVSINSHSEVLTIFFYQL